ncbi:MAG: VanW family protein [Clostridia bacterium]|nr:VanW family protein [Clostridia bacterium]
MEVKEEKVVEKDDKEIINNITEEIIDNKESDIQKDDFEFVENNIPKKKPVFFYVLLSTFCIFVLIFLLFTIYNMINPNIVSGVSIKGIDVSNMSKSDAKLKLQNYVNSKMPEEITVKHGDYEATLSIAQMDAKFDLKMASTSAYNVGRTNNILKNNIYVLMTMFKKVDIEPLVTLNKTQLVKNLEDISSQLPDKVIESSYYIDENELVIQKGKNGTVVDIEASIEKIRNSISDFTTPDNPIELVVKDQAPEKINIEKIYKEVKREPKDAYYTTEPFTVVPSENGFDFNISIEEAKALLDSDDKEEYSIPLKVISPNITTNMIGTEAFPDLLSTFSTHYVNNKNRTTNLILAANKINGTVLMPGETFSYNKTVGARTIAAGYKEAPIYVSGEVVDGLGGGICQITTTLYNAVVYANLEIVQRTNHQFIPSYAGASRDATVVYGAIDFQFKNNRNYPIKLVCSVSGGVANFKIFGLKQEDDYEVQISSYQTGSTASAIYSEAYKILKKDGVEVKRELLSKDTYKRH